MSSRDWFWFLAGVLVAVAIMVTVRAWLRERPAQAVRPSIPAFAVPIAAALALIGVALGIYFLLGSPDSIASSHAASAGQSSAPTGMGASTSASAGSSSSAGSLDDVTRKLATRLATKGGSDSEWKLLAESYDYMGQADQAKAARAHIASAAPTAAGAAAGAGNVAGDGGAAGTAMPLESVSADQMAAVADALDSNSPTAENRPARGPAGSVQTTAGAGISGTVEIASKFASRAGAGAVLFIYAKQPNAPGPPLAVIRVQASHWPVSFTLSDANAMVPGRNLSNADSVQIEARVSRKGDALPQSGDLVGSVTSVNPRGGHPVKISIDKEIG
jgi:cytochrome c-type biogenesis protein CcmH